MSNKIESESIELNLFIKQALNKSLEQTFTENLKSNDELVKNIKEWLDSEKCLKK